MLYYIYSKKYGWRPLEFLIKKRDFYKERKKWVKEFKKPREINKVIHMSS